MAFDGVQKRLRGRPRDEYATFGGVAAAALRADAKRSTTLTWPNPRYLHDPEGFCYYILGFRLWDRQRDTINSVRDHKLTGVRAAQKVSKSRSAAALALWWYCCVKFAKVYMTASTGKQVEGVLYAEIQKLLHESGVCVDCKESGYDGPKPCPHSALIDGTIGATYRSGVRSSDFRLIRGFTSRTAEGIAGFSGAEQFYIVDESSGVPTAIYETIRGNLSGGGKALFISNPTKTNGWFYDIFHGMGQGINLIHISALDSPNIKAGRKVISGLAMPEEVKLYEETYGKQSPFYRVRVLGEFADVGKGRIFSQDMINAAYGAEPAGGDAHSVLSIGIDPSGPSGTGDEAGWCAVRGHRELKLDGFLGMDAPDYIELLKQWIEELKRPGETPVVTVDRDGKEGARIYGTLRAWADDPRNSVKVHLRGVRSGENPVRSINQYVSVRDELCGAVETWVKEGAKLLRDDRRESDLRALEWKESGKGNLTTLMSKKELKKVLGRSPDRYDALSLAVWNSATARTHTSANNPPLPPPPPSRNELLAYEPVVDPYEGQ